jgi:hypothetical protein
MRGTVHGLQAHPFILLGLLSGLLSCLLGEVVAASSFLLWWWG